MTISALYSFALASAIPADLVGVIYRITNLVTMDFYIGMTTKSLNFRLRCHRNSVAKGCRKGYLYNAIRKYGANHFVVDVLAFCEDIESLRIGERRLIHALQPAYNATDGGEGALGYKHSEVTRKLMSDQRRGKPRLYARGKVGTRRGIKISETTRQRMSAAQRKRFESDQAQPARYWLGKTRSPETIEKVRMANTGRKQTLSESRIETLRAQIRAAAVKNKKPVRALNTGVVFDSSVDAAKALGLRPDAVWSVAAGKRNSLYGHRFEFVP